MATLNETPSSNRLHIGVFGKVNSGKSSFINALTGQQVSIVADVAGTTTDPVYKAMEINPLGPCVLIDTAGFDDVSELGKMRTKKTGLAADKADIAVLVISAEELDLQRKTAFTDDTLLPVFEQERKWYKHFSDDNIPVLIAVNKIDCLQNQSDIQKAFTKMIQTQIINKADSGDSDNILFISARDGFDVNKVKNALARLVPEGYGNEYITGNLVNQGDLVLLVMPQDIQAPKGRLILPQVQTIRELLDKKCHIMSVTTDEFVNALSVLNKPPKLIITDSQVFGYVYENKPKDSMLTSFSVLFAAYKGDINYYLEGAKAIDRLTDKSKVLIAECCTHAPLSEDIGRVKIPRLLRKRVGESLTIDLVSGTDFPEDIEKYDLVIQCGACMFNRKYVLSRIENVKEKHVPMTNYGVAIAHMTGILEQLALPQ